MKWLYRRGGKRLFDILLSCIGLSAFAIPMAWIAWRIRQESRCSAFFRQMRIGCRGKPFSILKFRTMSETGRITPFGRRLRSTAMDELPQLIHILKGQMSFVGPRPLIPDELQELHRIPNGARRLSMRPGLAGLAQLYSKKVPSLSERVRWDCEYADRCSLGLDLWIILKAVGITLQASWERSGPKVH